MPEPVPYDPESKPKERAALFVAARRSSAPPPWSMEWLVEFLRLNPWDISNASKQVRNEMYSAAEMLLLVFFYDWASVSAACYLMTPPQAKGTAARALAVFVGFAVARLVQIFQAGFWTTDTKTAGWKRFLPAIAARIAVVLILAVLIAMPFEALVFGAPISHRFQEERARVEVFRVYSAYKQAQTEAEGVGVEIVFERTEREDARQKADRTRQSLEQGQKLFDQLKVNAEDLGRQAPIARQNLNTAQANLTAANARLRAFSENFQGPAETEAAEEAVRSAQSQLAAFQKRLNKVETGLGRGSAQNGNPADRRGTAGDSQQRRGC